MDYEKRYLFHGQAVAAAAHVRRHNDKLIEGPPPVFPGAAALPSVGGSVESKSGPHEYSTPFGFVLSFGSARAHVSGDYIDSRKAYEWTLGQHEDEYFPTRTEATATVSNIDVLHRLKIENLNCNQVAEDYDGGQPRFRVAQTTAIDGVTLDGSRLEVELDHHLLAFATKDELAKQYEQNETFRKEYAERFCHPKGLTTKLFPNRAPDLNGKFITTIVKRMYFTGGTPDGVEIEGNRLTIPDFGRVYFGELIITANSRRLMLVRLRLGSPVGGSGNFGCTQPNGDYIP